MTALERWLARQGVDIEEMHAAFPETRPDSWRKPLTPEQYMDKIFPIPPSPVPPAVSKHVCWDGCFGGFHLERE